MFGKKKTSRMENEPLLSLNLNKDESEIKESDHEISENEISRHRKFTGQRKLFALAVITLFALGVLGAGVALSDKQNNVFSKLYDAITGGKRNQNSRVKNSLNPAMTGTLQLSKEYIYAGSRMLSTEDYGQSAIVSFSKIDPITKGDG